MKFTNIKRVSMEDFTDDARENMSKFGSIWNSFIDQFSQLVNKGIDFNNLNQEIKNVTFTTGSNGQPLANLTLKTSIKTNINGLIAISLKPANPQTLVTQMPFIGFNQNGDLIEITNITGLNKETRYSLTLLII